MEDSRIVANADLDTTVTLDWLYDDETHNGRGRNTLYVCMPEHPKDAARFAVVFGGLISALTDAAYEKRNRENKPLPNLLLVLDEAGNTAASWLPQISTTCASVGITLMTFWQSLAQITHRYGDQTNTLVTNHTTKIFFGGISDTMTGDAAAKLSGSQEVLTRSATTDRTTTGRHSTTENTTATPLVSADLVRQIKPFHALCIHGTLQPIHLRARKWWRNGALRARAEGNQLPDRTLADRLRPYAPDAAASGRDRGLRTTGSRADRQRATERHPRGGAEMPTRSE